MIPEVGSGHKYVRIFKEEKYIKKKYNISKATWPDQCNLCGSILKYCGGRIGPEWGVGLNFF